MLQTAWTEADRCQKAAATVREEAQEAENRALHAEARVTRVQASQPRSLSSLAAATISKVDTLTELHMTEALTVDSQGDMQLLIASWKVRAQLHS